MTHQPPAPALRRHVECYWRSLDNAQAQLLVVPDGCVDVVLQVHAGRWQAQAYGSTTRATTLPIRPGSHYLGIRFRPGRSRHFLQACAAELTDAQHDARALLQLPLEPLAERIAGPAAELAAQLDAGLASRLRQGPTAAAHADFMVQRIEAAQGVLNLAQLYQALDRHPRWLQRVFVQTVGITPKLYARIVKARRARALLAAGPGAALADVAAEAGYADQSHMTRDFARLLGVSPARCLAAFVQDAAPRGGEH
ncbi:MAG: DUF6597 domain-containing transcriptional factor [Pseudomonadota bacterium]